MPAEKRSEEYWTETAALAIAILEVSSSWIPAVVFGAPKDFFGDGENKPTPTVMQATDDATRGEITLNLFPLRVEGALQLTVNFPLDAKDEVVWPRALMAAFQDSTVKSVFIYEDCGDCSSEDKMKVNVKNGLHMLTGLPTEDATAKGPSSLREWLNGLSQEGDPNSRLSYNPTIAYNMDGGLRPVTASMVKESNGRDDYSPPGENVNTRQVAEYCYLDSRALPDPNWYGKNIYVNQPSGPATDDQAFDRRYKDVNDFCSWYVRLQQTESDTAHRLDVSPASLKNLASNGLLIANDYFQGSKDAQDYKKPNSS
ncbi:hypothetical protein QFC21_006707 [Naganishia friedmannii]|uniref:Uncharacterized protein n=1 Tax=Naganishia friedmannii TaxID=89922 RepID=A0ACC2V0N3_9TREE|nr:hypothetical protein QFC21_006707 [Naganishia friedmannii]